MIHGQFLTKIQMLWKRMSFQQIVPEQLGFQEGKKKMYFDPYLAKYKILEEIFVTLG